MPKVKRTVVEFVVKGSIEVDPNDLSSFAAANDKLNVGIAAFAQSSGLKLAVTTLTKTIRSEE
jgi:hypothetical protein